MKNMECNDLRELIPSKLCGDISPEQEKLLLAHLPGCEECRKEFEAAEKMWELLGKIPQAEPSALMTERFDNALKDHRKEGLNRGKSFRTALERIAESLFTRAIPRIAFSIILLAAGLGIGYFARPSNHPVASYNRQIDSLSSQVSELRQIMMLSLLQDQSAAMRLQAVSYTGELNSVDQQVIEALLMTLNKDPNVNVRLATLEALARLSDKPMVREGLVRSIANQESPLVQSAIADVMVKLNEKSSVVELKKLLSIKNLNQAVKTNIEESIQKLI